MGIDHPRPTVDGARAQAACHSEKGAGVVTSPFTEASPASCSDYGLCHAVKGPYLMTSLMYSPQP